MSQRRSFVKRRSNSGRALAVLTSRARSSVEQRLGVDESYTLELSADGGGVLRAASEWGALHGLETFASLAQWDGAHLLLCGLPLAVHDRPTFAWRGLLLDTSRHHLPLRTTLLRMIDAMSAMRLNVLHWHLVNAPRLTPHGTPPPHPWDPTLRRCPHPRLTQCPPHTPSSAQCPVPSAWPRPPSRCSAQYPLSSLSVGPLSRPSQ
jgi:hypothetical protein